MCWYVVKFVQEDSVEVVPTGWYNDIIKKCYWPSAGFNRYKIWSLIKHKESPKEDWLYYQAEILGRYDDLKVAEKKADKARTTDQLTTESEHYLGKGSRVKKPNKKYRHSSSSDLSSDTSSTVYPALENLAPISKSQLNVQKKKNITCTATERSEDTRQHQTNETGAFQRQVLRELNIISIKINNLMDDMHLLCTSINSMNNKDNLKTTTERTPDMILSKFPLTSISLEDVEIWLQEDENENMLVNELLRTGGSSVRNITKNIMYKIISNELGAQYSWEGAKRKMAFKKLGVAMVIKKSVMLSKNAKDSSEFEVIENIKKWLVRCPERLQKLEKKRENDMEAI